MDAVEEVKSRLNIEDVIGEYVQLKRAGRNWKGLSPFGNEKTPSFVVSPEKQIWHDFSSGKGGSMFSFVMEMEGLDFKAALELLARKAGVDIEQFRTSSSSRGPDKERLYKLLELAAKFYQAQFSQNKLALEYVLGKRKFSKATALEWKLGYSPNNGAALVDYAKSKGFTEAELKQAGLSSQRYNGAHDMFRGRLMIPLQDSQGRVIGFTARQLDEDPNAPKYINTPQTVLYDKSRHVYGLHLAKEAIRKTKFVVLVEGNLDVIASHQAGVKQVVATAGTALTEPHLKALARFTGDIRLSFDADKAGLAATERAIPIASRVKVSLGIITIPDAKDPDELINKSVEAWVKAIEGKQYALDWLMQRYAGLLDIKTAEGKRKYSDELLPVVRALNDAVERDHYLNAIAEKIGVSREALEQKATALRVASPGVNLKRPRHTPEQLDKQTIEQAKTENHFLSLMLLQPKLREHLATIEPAMLMSGSARELAEFLKANPDFSGKPIEATGLQSLGDYVKIIVLQYEELYQDLELTELRYEATRLQVRLIGQYVKNQKQTLVAELAGADEATTQMVLQKVKHLDSLLNRTKGDA